MWNLLFHTTMNISSDWDPLTTINQTLRLRFHTTMNNSRDKDPLTINQTLRCRFHTTMNISSNKDPLTTINQTLRPRFHTTMNISSNKDPLTTINQTLRCRFHTTMNISRHWDPLTTINHALRCRNGFMFWEGSICATPPHHSLNSPYVTVLPVLIARGHDVPSRSKFESQKKRSNKGMVGEGGRATSILNNSLSKVFTRAIYLHEYFLKLWPLYNFLVCRKPRFNTANKFFSVKIVPLSKFFIELSTYLELYLNTFSTLMSCFNICFACISSSFLRVRLIQL